MGSQTVQSALLEWAIRNGADAGQSSEAPQPMDPEKARFLEEFLSQGCVDPNVLMFSALDKFTSDSLDIDERLDAADTLQDLIEMPQFSKNLRNNQGWTKLIASLNDKSKPIVKRAAELIGASLGNNPSGCEAVLKYSEGHIHRLISRALETKDQILLQSALRIASGFLLYAPFVVCLQAIPQPSTLLTAVSEQRTQYTVRLHRRLIHVVIGVYNRCHDQRNTDADGAASLQAAVFSEEFIASLKLMSTWIRKEVDLNDNCDLTEALDDMDCILQRV